MNCLLDTHVLVWSQEEKEKIGPVAASIIADLENELFISPISTLEIARLVQSGNITLKGTLKNWIQKAANNLLAQTVEFSHEIAVLAYGLKGPFHKDPADRILAASALNEQLTFITADRKILEYPFLKSIDARK